MSETLEILRKEVKKLEVEVDRLREELSERASMGSLQNMAARLNDAEYNLANERAAHEATKAELGWMQGEAQSEHNRAAAAETKATELEEQRNGYHHNWQEAVQVGLLLKERVAELEAEVALQSAQADRFAIAVLNAERLLIAQRTAHESEVSRLREELKTERVMHQKTEDCIIANWDEKLGVAMRAADAAEARVAELGAAIDQIRAVCLRACPDGTGSVHISTADLWPLLRAHHEPATPDPEARIHQEGAVARPARSVRVSATPAATGEEPTGAVELMRIERELARAEKERGT